MGLVVRVHRSGQRSESQDRQQCHLLTRASATRQHFLSNPLQIRPESTEQHGVLNYKFAGDKGSIPALIRQLLGYLTSMYQLSGSIIFREVLAFLPIHPFPVNKDRILWRANVQSGRIERTLLHKAYQRLVYFPSDNGRKTTRWGPSVCLSGPISVKDRTYKGPT